MRKAGQPPSCEDGLRRLLAVDAKTDLIRACRMAGGGCPRDPQPLVGESAQGPRNEAGDRARIRDVLLAPENPDVLA